MKKLLIVFMLMLAGLLVYGCGSSDTAETPDKPVIEDPIEVEDPADEKPGKGEKPDNEGKGGKEDGKGEKPE